MSISTIEAMLYDAMGLNSASIGTQAIMYAVQQRMSQCSVSDITHYTKKLSADKNEIKQLIEEVVVAETWFFRDKRPFTMLTRFIKDEWADSNSDKVIRILSLPCATGEEPYSIAITLIEAGLMPSQLKIDAVDISERNIKRCNSACYRKNSFRGVDPYIRDRFFNVNTNNNYNPDILIKAMVNFEVASVLDSSFINTQIPYDVVFCRNLLIYFDRKTQARALKMLDKILKPQGMLFVGHAETAIYTNNWYISKRYPRSFVIRKFNDDTTKQIKPKKQIKAADSITSKVHFKTKSTVKSSLLKNNKPNKIFNIKTKTKIKSANKNVESVSVSSKAKKVVDIDTSLAKAQQLADSGMLVEAEKICIKYLASNKHDKEVYYLLAIIQLAIGDEQKSLEYFKNVIYLAPDHYDSLMYLATLLTGQGDAQAASRYRDRASRIKVRLNL